MRAGNYLVTFKPGLPSGGSPTRPALAGPRPKSQAQSCCPLKAHTVTLPFLPEEETRFLQKQNSWATWGRTEAHPCLVFFSASRLLTRIVQGQRRNWMSCPLKRGKCPKEGLTGQQAGWGPGWVQPQGTGGSTHGPPPRESPSGHHLGVCRSKAKCHPRLDDDPPVGTPAPVGEERSRGERGELPRPPGAERLRTALHVLTSSDGLGGLQPTPSRPAGSACHLPGRSVVDGTTQPHPRPTTSWLLPGAPLHSAAASRSPRSPRSPRREVSWPPHRGPVTGLALRASGTASCAHPQGRAPLGLAGAAPRS